MKKVKMIFFMGTEELAEFNKARLLHYAVGPHFELDDGTFLYCRVGSFTNLPEYDNGEDPVEISVEEKASIMTERWTKK